MQMTGEDRRTNCCVVGVGYVGLDIAHMLTDADYPTVGYDIDDLSDPQVVDWEADG